MILGDNMTQNSKSCENELKSKKLMSDNLHYVNWFDGVLNFSQLAGGLFSPPKTNFFSKTGLKGRKIWNT